MEKIEFRRFGLKTFIFFTLEKGGIFIGLIFLIIGTVILASYLPMKYGKIILEILPLEILAALAVFLGTLVVAWIEYIHYSVSFNPEDFRVTRGFLSVEEFGFPYYRIKEVKISQNILERLLGLCDLVITVGEQASMDDMRLILPTFEQRVGLTIQDELLKRSQAKRLSAAV